MLAPAQRTPDLVWYRTAAILGLAIAIAWVIRRIGTAEAALVWLGGVFVAYAAFHAAMLARLNRWSALPASRPVPEGLGAWRPVLDRVARFMRRQSEDTEEREIELRRIRDAVDRLPDALVVLDRFDHVEWSNATAQQRHGIFGSRRPIHHFIRNPEFVAYLEGGRFGVPLRLALPNSPGLTFEIRIHASEDGSRLLIGRDVTDQAKLDAMRSDFVANVSHEIRTPVTVIGGFAETMLTLELSEAERRDYLQAIARHSKTMQRLVDDLLTLSTLESALDRPEDEPIRVRRLFDALADEARALSAGRHRIESYADARASLLGVPSEIESAVRNLLTNAVRYTPQSGRITLSWRRETNGDGMISVRDTGIGIAPEHLPRLTERFYRIDRGRSRETGGTGLGLAIVKRIATRHGARLEIESHLGEGSTFALRFPANRVLLADETPAA